MGYLPFPSYFASRFTQAQCATQFQVFPPSLPILTTTVLNSPPSPREHFLPFRYTSYSNTLHFAARARAVLWSRKKKRDIALNYLSKCRFSNKKLSNVNFMSFKMWKKIVLQTSNTFFSPIRPNVFGILSSLQITTFTGFYRFYDYNQLLVKICSPPPFCIALFHFQITTLNSRTAQVRIL